MSMCEATDKRGKVKSHLDTHVHLILVHNEHLYWGHKRHLSHLVVVFVYQTGGAITRRGFYLPLAGLWCPGNNFLQILFL